MSTGRRDTHTHLWAAVSSNKNSSYTTGSVFSRTSVEKHDHQGAYNAAYFTTLTNLITKYHVMCKVYTDVGGIIKL